MTSGGVSAARRALGPAAYEIGLLASFALVTLVLTWPLALSGADSFSIRGDYASNLWNIWWVRTSLFELGASPYWTDYLFFPEGASLALHTLSPLNSLVGALASFALGVKGAYNFLLFAHFWLGAWTFFLFARYLCGSELGAYLGGLLYSFGPFHFYYLAQINVASIESLPLAALFFLKSYREGGWKNLLAAGLCTLLVAASHWYYLVCLFLFCAFLLVAGRLWDATAPPLASIGRACGAGLISALLVAPLAWPLLSATFGEVAPEDAPVGNVVREAFAYGNDLLGQKWVDFTPHLAVSWPTMLGYSAWLVLIAGIGQVRRQPFWLVVGLLFWLVSLGNPIRVGGWITEVPSPFAWLFQIPGFEMFRKPDRVFIMVQLVFALLCAFAWKGIAARIPSRRLAMGVWAGVCAIAMLELSGAPLARFPYDCSPYYEGLAADADVVALIEVPVLPGGHFSNGRYNLCQLAHQKKMPQGYVTSLAVTKRHAREAGHWQKAYRELLAGDGARFLRRIAERDIDRVVLNKLVPSRREQRRDVGPVVWQPFRLVRKPLLEARQLGPLVPAAVGPRRLQAERLALMREFGAPEYEDERIAVFRVDGR